MFGVCREKLVSEAFEQDSTVHWKRRSPLKRRSKQIINNPGQSLTTMTC